MPPTTDPIITSLAPLAGEAQAGAERQAARVARSLEELRAVQAASAGGTQQALTQLQESAARQCEQVGCCCCCCC